MHKFKPSTSVSSDDDAPSLNGYIAEKHPNSSFTTTPTRKKAHSPGSSGEHTINVAAGRLPEDVYTNTLPSWRVAIRRKFVAVVEKESKVIAEWQARVRSPRLDTFFQQTSMLGTHTFFLAFLPIFFFFGYDKLGRE